jgi:hypothetical protein
MAPVVSAFQAMRGVSFIAAVIFVAELGDLRRFDSPRQLMSYLGLVPSERSTGETVRRGGITKTGNSRARRVLVEGAWTYRHTARVGRVLLDRMRDLPKSVRDIAHSFGSAAAIESSFSAASRRRSSSRRSPARWRLSSGRSLVRCHREQQWYEARRHKERSASRHPPEKRVRVAKVRQGQPCGLPLARLAALTAFVASDDSASIGWKERNGPQPHQPIPETRALAVQGRRRTRWGIPVAALGGRSMIDARSKTGKAPEVCRKGGTQSAYQSLSNRRPNAPPPALHDLYPVHTPSTTFEERDNASEPLENRHQSAASCPQRCRRARR